VRLTRGTANTTTSRCILEPISLGFKSGNLIWLYSQIEKQVFTYMPSWICKTKQTGGNQTRSFGYRNGLVAYFKGKGFVVSARPDSLPDDDFVYMSGYSTCVCVLERKWESVCISMTYVYTYTHTHTHTYTQTHARVHIPPPSPHTHACTYVCTCIDIY